MRFGRWGRDFLSILHSPEEVFLLPTDAATAVRDPLGLGDLSDFLVNILKHFFFIKHLKV